MVYTVAWEGDVARSGLRHACGLWEEIAISHPGDPIRNVGADRYVRPLITGKTGISYHHLTACWPWDYRTARTSR